jgi:hypothetical protein
VEITHQASRILFIKSGHSLFLGSVLVNRHITSAAMSKFLHKFSGASVAPSEDSKDNGAPAVDVDDGRQTS